MATSPFFFRDTLSDIFKVLLKMLLFLNEIKLWVQLLNAFNVEEIFSCVPNRILALLCFSAVRLLCGALVSTWVVLSQIVHCPFYTYRK